MSRKRIQCIRNAFTKYHAQVAQGVGSKEDVGSHWDSYDTWQHSAHPVLLITTNKRTSDGIYGPCIYSHAR